MLSFNKLTWYNLAQNSFGKNMIKIKEYVKENWGSPFLVGFIFLIVGASVSLSFGLFYLANTGAVYAFYALIVGFFLQFICYLKYSHGLEREAS
jgi:hypothetical protein